MQEIRVKTHLIITEIREEYQMDWCGKLADFDPIFDGSKLMFVLIGSEKRTELSTLDINRVEEIAKKMTNPRGRESVTSDHVDVYVREKNGKNRLLGVLTHRRIKTFSPMYDKVYFN